MRTLAPAGGAPSLERSAARARQVAKAAAQRAGVEVTEVGDLAGIARVCALFDEVWRTSEGESILPAGVLRALAHAGNYCAAAFDGEVMVGALAGFLGRDEEGPYLHSHILGVDERARGRHVGFALKQHQRAWALERGLAKVTWTFDPLVRRNAYFNLQKLGADAARYYEHFYGTMTDEVNAGDETDRLLVAWLLDGERAARAAAGQLGVPDVVPGAAVALDEEGRVHPVSGPTVLCATPHDIVKLRKSHPEQALAWRRALRATLGRAMADGWRILGFTRSGSYVLRRDGDAVL